MFTSPRRTAGKFWGADKSVKEDTDMKIFHNKKFGKVVMMALLPLLASLPGCNKPPEHTVEDIRSVSVSCGHMDYSHSYSFYLRKTENGWLLDAEFATDTEHPRVGYEECPVTEGDVKKLLTIVQEQNLTEQLRRYKKPIIKVQVLDETTYYSSISFTDGEILGAPIQAGNDITDCFYRLAEKYTGTMPDIYNTQTNPEEE